MNAHLSHSGSDVFSNQHPSFQLRNTSFCTVTLRDRHIHTLRSLFFILVSSSTLNDHPQPCICNLLPNSVFVGPPTCSTSQRKPSGKSRVTFSSSLTCGSGDTVATLQYRLEFALKLLLRAALLCIRFSFFALTRARAHALVFTVRRPPGAFRWQTVPVAAGAARLRCVRKVLFALR